MSNINNIHDEELRAFFQQNKPEVSGSDDFMAMLASRLDEVDARAAEEAPLLLTKEDVLNIQKAAHKQTRLAVFAALAVGIVVGVSLSLSLFFHPLTLADVGVDASQIESAATSAKTIFSKWSSLILCLFSFSVCGLGLWPVLKKQFN